MEEIGPAADFYKVGMELYAVGGLPFVSQLRTMGKQIFLDLKLYDISETVKRATRQFCERSGATFLTVHGSRAVMQAAVEGRGNCSTKLLAVTVLTSFDRDDLADLGYSVPVAEGDQKRVATPRQAIGNGADYLVIGRQVTRAAHPRRAVEDILNEIAG